MSVADRAANNVWRQGWRSAPFARQVSSELDPGRLHGEDLYNVVDETFAWNPLALLLGTL